MKAIHLVPASVLALAVGVTGMAALAQDGQRQGATNAPDPFMIDFKWEAARNSPAPPQAKYDGIDGESNDAVVRNPTASPQSTQAPKPDGQGKPLIITLENCAVGSSSCTAPANGGATGRSTAQYNPKEVGVDKIQSPRDPATGQATGNSQQAAGPSQGQPGTQGIKLTDILVSSATAPNNPANETAQSARITSPRDSASGQATGERRQGPGTGQSQDKLGNFEIQDLRSGTAQTGTTALGNSQQDPAAAGQPAGFSWGLAQTGYGVKETAEPSATNANAIKSKPPRNTSGARKKRKPRS